MSATGSPLARCRRAAGLRAGRFPLRTTLHAVEGVACRRRYAKMNCDEAEILLHGLVDNEIDAEHACRIETHVGDCACCAAQVRLHRVMRQGMLAGDLRFSPTARLRRR